MQNMNTGKFSPNIRVFSSVLVNSKEENNENKKKKMSHNVSYIMASHNYPKMCAHIIK